MILLVLQVFLVYAFPVGACFEICIGEDGHVMLLPVKTVSAGWEFTLSGRANSTASRSAEDPDHHEQSGHGDCADLRIRAADAVVATLQFGTARSGIDVARNVLAPRHEPSAVAPSSEHGSRGVSERPVFSPLLGFIRTAVLLI